jgi:hypothetical protein
MAPLFNVSVNVAATVVVPPTPYTMVVTAQLFRIDPAAAASAPLQVGGGDKIMDPVLGSPGSFTETFLIADGTVKPGHVLFVVAKGDVTMTTTDTERSAPKTVPASGGAAGPPMPAAPTMHVPD